jgi:PRTRC genetic system protein C
MSVEDVCGVLVLQYPEIATAAITGPEPVGDTLRYTFERSVQRGDGRRRFYPKVTWRGE